MCIRPDSLVIYWSVCAYLIVRQLPTNNTLITRPLSGRLCMVIQVKDVDYTWILCQGKNRSKFKFLFPLSCIGHFVYPVGWEGIWKFIILASYIRLYDNLV